MANIAVLGNHETSFCTERELDWTLEKLGHSVFRLQENKVSALDVEQVCRERGIKLLIYVHTHGWDVQGDLFKMLENLKRYGTKTCSFHLDRFFGLNQLDQRESRIGTHAFWKTDVVFTADGGNEDGFRAKGVNHVWMPPAVVERDCYFGTFRPWFATPLVFTGADGYHPEYPFRPRMVDALRSTFGASFRIYQGIREANLNDLYASARIVVGDSCFAGADRYWSDRVPEVIGRGGFLVFPETPGLSIPGLVTYKPQDVDDLVRVLKYWLDDQRDAERIQRRNAAHQWVKTNATYTNRMATLLQVMEIK
jgi:hypothetical protein